MCDRCHGEVIDDTQSFVAPQLHVNGTVEVAEMDCNSCHGNDVNAAPPVDTFGSSDDTLVSVGAHQSHLGPSNWHREVLCDDCHLVPATVDDPGHLDDAPAEVIWGAVALADGAAPGPFDALAATCTGIYCHGSTLYPGGSNTDPVWTVVGSGQADCLTCHSNPPGDQHPAVALCEVCHGMVYDGENFVDPARHVNGSVDVTGQGCTSCHGNSDNTAPPVDTLGESDTGFVTVGAHQSHLTDGDLRLAIECTECHYVPMVVDDPAHIDGFPADLTWGPLATADSAVPDWDHTAEQCTNVYCHGTTIGGGSNKEPIWTIVDGTQAGCGTCHGFPPPPAHPADFDCAACHPGTVISGVEIDVAGGLHIDGIVQ
jgi:predicted CxxxxCH...CXXCH cytochrome family protein